MTELEALKCAVFDNAQAIGLLRTRTRDLHERITTLETPDAPHAPHEYPGSDNIRALIANMNLIVKNLGRIERALSVLGSLAGQQDRIELILKGFGDVG
jgi:hypothetical protein